MQWLHKLEFRIYRAGRFDGNDGLGWLDNRKFMPYVQFM